MLDGATAPGKMHIVIVQPTPNSTTFGWESGLEALGHQVTLVTKSKKLQFGGRPGAHIVVLPDRRVPALMERALRRVPFGLDTWPARSQVRSMIRGLHPDLVLIKADAWRNIVIAMVVRRMGIRTCIWQEKLPPLSRRWRLLRRLGLLPSTAFTALDSRPGGVGEPESESRLPRISYSAPTWQGDESETPERTDSSVRVLVVASFKNHVVKRQWWVLEAAAAAGLLDGRMRFTFMGYGNAGHWGYRRTQELVDRLSIQHLVDFEFGVDHAGMKHVYDRHDVIVLPSKREQFGMTVVEAMSRVRPVIISDAVGAIGCVIPERTGLIFPVNDQSALSEALRVCIEEPERLRDMGRLAGEFAEQHLSSRGVAQQILNLAFAGDVDGR